MVNENIDSLSLADSLDSAFVRHFYDVRVFDRGKGDFLITLKTTENFPWMLTLKTIPADRHTAPHKAIIRFDSQGGLKVGLLGEILQSLVVILHVFIPDSFVRVRRASRGILF